MFRKFETEYNLKIDFKMIFSINPLFDPFSNFNEIKDYFRYNKNVVSKQGLMFKALKEIFDDLKKRKINELTVYDLSLISKRINSNENEKSYILFIDEIKKLNDDVITNAVKIYQSIIIFNVFSNMSSEMALLFMNSYLVYNHYIPLVLFKNELSYFSNLVKNNVTLLSLKEIFISLNDVSSRYINKYKEISKDEIIKRILNNKEFLKHKYKVEKLWLFGSFAKNCATAYSDVDLFIKSSDNSCINELELFLSSLLERPVDIQSEKHFNERFAMYPALDERELIFNEDM